MDYTGFYINLDRSPERRAEMETHLAQYGLEKNYRRFAAADGNSLNFPNTRITNGEMGCFISHYLLLKENLDQTLPLHAVEDDVLFSRFTEQAIRAIVGGGAMAHYDIVYTDLYIPISNVLYKKYKEIYDKSLRRDDKGQVSQTDLNVVDMKDVGFASTASMIISPRSIRKLHDLYAAELAKGPDTPVDLFIRRKTDEGVIKVGCIFPFVTSVRLEHHVFDTTIRGQDILLSELAGNIARQAFFIECDWNKCREYLAKYLPLPPGDAQLQILTHILGFSLDEKFRFR